MSYESLHALIEARAGERAIAALLKSNLHLLARSVTYGPIANEYIAFSELSIKRGKVDFCVLHDRSRMAVVFIEIKGADFPFLNQNGQVNRAINDAAQKIRERVEVSQSEEFRREIHEIRQQALDDRCPFNCLVGPDGLPHVDPLKDIQVRSLVIGGYTPELRDRAESRERNRLERYGPKATFESWDSWLRRHGEVGGRIRNAATTDAQ